MATAGEKIAALAVDLQAAVDAARAQSAEFADAFGCLNLALGTAVTAAELPDMVRKRLHADAEIARRAVEDRAAAEKRAQDAARAVGYFGHLGEEFVAFLRALKTRSEGAERAASAMDGSAYVRGAERDREEWRKRALTAESTLVERNRELDAAKDALRNERFISDGLRKDFELAQEAAHKVATMAAEEAASLRAKHQETAEELGRANGRRNQIAEERDALRAQVESLRGEDEPVRLRPLNLEATRAERWRIHNANMEWIASLPSPSSPKTGRWKCRGCGKELLATAWTGSGSRWAQSFDAKTWIHWCENNLGSSPADRIGDAPEVTP